jgi:hypothetical protein
MTNDEIQNIAILSEVLIKVAAIERLLLLKGFLTKEELSKEINDISTYIAKSMLKGAKVSGDLDKILEELTTENRDDN